MNDYILLMHNDGGPTSDDAWGGYLKTLNESGCFQGGSSIGYGVCFSKNGEGQPITGHLSGYIKIKAENIEGARLFLIGNPVFESGGTVEIRELPRD